MVFNSDKFELIRYWPRADTKPDISYSDPAGNIIEEKVHLRDLGVEMSNDLTFNLHIENVVAGANKLVGWALRTFRRRSSRLMLTIWKSYVQSKLDYCSQLWSPSNQGSIAKLESVARNFTSQIGGLDGLDYWERLSKLNMYSQERRRERYEIIFIWKVSKHRVKGYTLPFRQNPRLGRVVELPPIARGCPGAVQQAHEASLRVKGAKLFNLLPAELRNLEGVMVDTFKAGLDAWLGTVPDQPTIPGRQRAANTNSLLDQVPLLN